MVYLTILKSWTSPRKYSSVLNVLRPSEGPLGVDMHVFVLTGMDSVGKTTALNMLKQRSESGLVESSIEIHKIVNDPTVEEKLSELERAWEFLFYIKRKRKERGNDRLLIFADRFPFPDHWVYAGIFDNRLPRYRWSDEEEAINLSMAKLGIHMLVALPHPAYWPQYLEQWGEHLPSGRNGTILVRERYLQFMPRTQMRVGLIQLRGYLTVDYLAEYLRSLGIRRVWYG